MYLVYSIQKLLQLYTQIQLARHILVTYVTFFLSATKFYISNTFTHHILGIIDKACMEEGKTVVHVLLKISSTNAKHN